MPTHDDEFDRVLAELSHHIRLIDILQMLKVLRHDDLQQRIDKQLRISGQTVETLKKHKGIK